MRPDDDPKDQQGKFDPSPEDADAGLDGNPTIDAPPPPPKEGE